MNTLTPRRFALGSGDGLIVGRDVTTGDGDWEAGIATKTPDTIGARVRPNVKLSDCRENGAPGAKKGTELRGARNGNRPRQFAGAKS